jgi:hypothetical protein
MLAHIELFEWWDGLQGEVGGGNYRGAFAMTVLESSDRTKATSKMINLSVKSKCYI